MKLKIAIVEDEEYYIKSLYNNIYEFAKHKNISVEIHVYHNANQFFFAWERGIFDIIFLDIYLKGSEDGTAIAKQIRYASDNTPIIFVTTASDRIGEGYDYQAAQYLVKPIKTKKLFSCLDRISNKLQTLNKESFIIKKRDIIMRIPYDDILYFSKDLHFVLIHTQNEIYRTLIGFKELISNIPPAYKDNFVQCHRSSIVNIAYIFCMDRAQITMVNRETIRMSERYLSSVREAYGKFYSK